MQEGTCHADIGTSKEAVEASAGPAFPSWWGRRRCATPLSRSLAMAGVSVAVSGGAGRRSSAAVFLDNRKPSFPLRAQHGDSGGTPFEDTSA